MDSYSKIVRLTNIFRFVGKRQITEKAWEEYINSDGGHFNLGIEPVQALMDIINKSIYELNEIDKVRLWLETARANLDNEFKNRVACERQLAKNNVELQIARQRIQELESIHTSLIQRNMTLEDDIGSLGVELDDARAIQYGSAAMIERLRSEQRDALNQIEMLKATVSSNANELFNFKAENELLKAQLQSLDSNRADSEASLARLKDSNSDLEVRMQSALGCIEQLTADNISLERLAGELKAARYGDQELSTQLSSQLEVSRVEVRRANEIISELQEAGRVEVAGLRIKLEEANARIKRLQQLNGEASSDRTTTLDERSKLLRDASSLQTENRRLVKKVGDLEGWLIEWRARFANVEEARLSATNQAEQLQLSLAQAEAAIKRSQAVIDRQATQLSELKSLYNSQENSFRDEIVNLKGALAQVQAELNLIKSPRSTALA